MTREEFEKEYLLDIINYDVLTKDGDKLTVWFPKKSFCSINTSNEEGRQDNMNKSLKFVKNKIDSGMFDFDFRADAKWDVLNFIDNVNSVIGKEFFIGNKFLCDLLVKHEHSHIKVPISIEYDPNADFQYITHESCRCDGTLSFVGDQMGKIWFKLCTLGTYNKNAFPDDFEENMNKYEIRYTVGDFVLADEFSKDFGTQEKPWMTTRFTTMLPIKNEFVRVGDKDEGL